MGRAATEREALDLAKKASYSPKRKQKIYPRFAKVDGRGEWVVEVHVKRRKPVARKR